MSGIEELQQRVVEAEKKFGLINEQRVKYSERLTDLISAIETRITDQQAEIARHTAEVERQTDEIARHTSEIERQTGEIERQTAEIERQAGEIASRDEEVTVLRQDSAENKLLRGMLHSLLQAIEAGGRDTLSETIQGMDGKISSLLSGQALAAPGDAEDEPEAPEAPTAEIDATDPQIDDPAADTDAPEAEIAEDLPQAMEVSEDTPDDLPEAEVEMAAPEDPAAEAEPAAEPEMEAPAAEEDIAVEDMPEADPVVVLEVEAPAAEDDIAVEDMPEAEPAAELEMDAPAAEGDIAVEDMPEAEPTAELAVDAPAAEDNIVFEDMPEADLAAELAAEAAKEPVALDEPAIDDVPAAEETELAEVEEAPVAETEEALVAEAEDIPSDTDIESTQDQVETPGTSDVAAMAEAPEADPGLESLIDDEQAVPDIPAVADVAPDTGGIAEASSLEDIMRRVSKLLEDEGEDGPLSGGNAQSEESAAAPFDPADLPKTATGV